VLDTGLEPLWFDNWNGLLQSRLVVVSALNMAQQVCGIDPDLLGPSASNLEHQPFAVLQSGVGFKDAKANVGARQVLQSMCPSSDIVRTQGASRGLDLDVESKLLINFQS